MSERYFHPGFPCPWCGAGSAEDGIAEGASEFGTPVRVPFVCERGHKWLKEGTRHTWNAVDFATPETNYIRTEGDLT